MGILLIYILGAVLTVGLIKYADLKLKLINGNNDKLFMGVMTLIWPISVPVSVGIFGLSSLTKKIF